MPSGQTTFPAMAMSVIHHPHIDSIAEKGIIFTNAYAPSSWTAPSVVSLLTSVYPINHGVTHGLGYKKNVTRNKQAVFSDELVTLAEMLKAHGYRTFGVASNLHLGEQFGLARGFNYFKCLPFLPAPAVNKTIYSWEDEIKHSDKFFLWIHYFDPHHFYHARNPWVDNYTPPELTRKLKLSRKSQKKLHKFIPVLKKDPEALSNLVALYDSEINYVDSYIGELIHRFELDKNTLIIITSDHGEEFLEKGKLGHGKNLYRETINIPLIVKLPQSSRKKEVKKHASLVDVMPTILHFLGINPPEHILGKSLWEAYDLLFWLKKILSRNDTMSYNFSELDTGSTLKALITPQWKYIYNYKNKREELYDLKSDFRELNNLASKETKHRDRLRDALFNWVETAPKYPTQKGSVTFSTEEKEKLKALGYVQ